MKKPTNAKLMPVLLGFLILVGLYVLVVKPQRSDLADARDRTESARTELESAKALLGQVKREWGDAQAGTDPLAAAIPSTPELAQLLRDLQAMAGEAGVTYASVGPSPLSSNPDGPGGSISLSVNASGSRASLDAYLGQLRDHQRLFVIEQLSRQLNSDPKVDSALTLTVRVFTIENAEDV